MANEITPTTAIAYLLTDGSVRDKSGDSNFHPNSTQNQIIVYVEDGDSNNVMTINYNPAKRKKWASHWYPLFYRGMTTATLEGESEPRTFAQYQTYMPTIVSAMNINSETAMGVNITVRQQAGNNLIGSYATVASLPTSYGDWLDLQDLNENNVVAYVYEAGVNGFYMVEYDGTYAWTLQTSGITNYVTAKPYDVWECSVLGGFNNPNESTELTDEQYRLIWQELSQLSSYYSSNYELIQDLIDGTTPAGEAVADQNGNVINTTYQLLSNLVTAFQATPDDTHYASEKLIYDTIQAILAGTTEFDFIKFVDGLEQDDVTDTRAIHYDSYEELFRAVLDDGTDLLIGGELQKRAYNDNGNMTEGTIVYINGSQGQRVTFDLYDISLTGTHSGIPAIITQPSGIASSALGKLNFFGEISLPTANFESSGTAYAEGQTLYVSENSLPTNVAPDKPNLQIHLGTIEKISGATAKVFINFFILPHFVHLSDVDVTSLANGDVWKYDTATSLLVPDNRVTSLVTANMIKSIVRTGTDLITITYYDNSTATVITLAELKTFIGNATSSLSGLMSATDKSRVDFMYALITDQAADDVDSIVDTVGEILEIFASYPEGADLVTALAAKVDKTTTIVGIDLSDNIEKDELRTALEINNVDNTSDADKPISDDTQTALDTKRDNDPSALVPITAAQTNNADLINIWDVSANALKTMTVAEWLALIATGTVSFINSAEYESYGLGAYESAVLDIHTATLNTGAQVYINIKTVETNKIYYIQLPTISSTNNLALSVNGSSGTYYNVLGGTSNISGADVSGSLLAVYYNGSNFVLIGGNGLDTTVPYASSVGTFNESKAGLPVATKGKNVLSLNDYYSETIAQLVQNGDDFSTYWAVATGDIVISDGDATFSPDGVGSDILRHTIQFTPISGQSIYVKVNYHSNTLTGSDVIKVNGASGTNFSTTGIINNGDSGVIVTVDNASATTLDIWMDGATGGSVVVTDVLAIPLPPTITSVAQAEALLAGTYFESLNWAGKPRTYTASEWTTQMQEYFASVGVEEGDTLTGVYIPTQGKNLFDGKFNPTTTADLEYEQLADNIFTIKATGATGYDTSNIFPSIKFVENKQYTFSGSAIEDNDAGNCRLRIRYTDGTLEDMFSVTTTTNTFSKTSNASKSIDYITFRYSASNYTTTVTNLMINIGSTATAYEPHINNTLHINGQFHGIGGVYDTLDTQRFARDYNDVVQSATSWGQGTDLGTFNVFAIDLTSQLGYKVPSVNTVVPNLKLRIGTKIFTSVSDLLKPSDSYIVYITTGGSLRIAVSDSEATNATEFETYLQSNDVEFIYELDTYLPRTEENNNLIEVDGALWVELGGHYQQQSNGVIGTFTTVVPLDVEAQVKAQALTDLKQGKEIAEHEERLDRAESNIAKLLAGYTEDMKFPATRIRQGATSKPDFDTTNVALLFPQNDATEIAYIVAQIPHKRIPNSDIWPHIHCRLSGSGQPVMKIDYKWYNPNGEAIPSSWTTYIMNINTATWSSGTISNMIYGSSAIDGSGMTDSSILLIKLYRDDNVYSGDLLVDEFDIHYQASNISDDYDT